jgi:hypothetical protein
MYAVASWSNLAAEVGIVTTDLNDFKQWIIDDDGCVVLDVNVSKHKVSGNLQLVPGTQSNYYLASGDSSDQLLVRTEKVFDTDGSPTRVVGTRGGCRRPEQHSDELPRHVDSRGRAREQPAPSRPRRKTGCMRFEARAGDLLQRDCRSVRFAGCQSSFATRPRR